MKQDFACHAEPFDPSTVLRTGYAQDRLHEASRSWLVACTATVVNEILRRGVYPEPVEGLLRMTYFHLFEAKR